MGCHKVEISYYQFVDAVMVTSGHFITTFDKGFTMQDLTNDEILETLNGRYTCEENEDGTHDLTFISIAPDKNIMFLNGLDDEGAILAIDGFIASEMAFWEVMAQGFDNPIPGLPDLDEDDEFEDDVDEDNFYVDEYEELDFEDFGYGDIPHSDEVGAHSLRDEDLSAIAKIGSISIGSW